ncbi:MAG: hypothetical protein ACI90V_009997 [Bacillariaceae sp.]|jgi:hypothetical protein
MMDSFMEFLLRKHDVNSSDVTIVDDKACPELSSALFQLNKPNTAYSSPHTNGNNASASASANSNANKKCRWSNITDDMNDLRIAKRNLTDLRRSWSIPFITSTSASSSIGGVSQPYNRSSFPNDSYNHSNAGWNDNALWDDVSSISKTFKSRVDKMQQQEDSDDDGDDTMIDAEGEEEDTGSDDIDENENISENSIDILEDFLEDWAVRKDLDSNSNSNSNSNSKSKTKKLSSSSSCAVCDESDATASTYDMENSYQSFLDYNKLVSNIHSVTNLNHQAPKLPQRKISQDKLRSLSSFLSSDSSLQHAEEDQYDSSSNCSAKSNASFGGTQPKMTAVVSVSEQDSGRSGKSSPFNILPFIKNAAQIVSTNTKKKKTHMKKKKDASNKKQKQPIIPAYGGGAKSNDSVRIQRLREALGPMAPATKDIDRNNMKSRMIQNVTNHNSNNDDDGDDDDDDDDDDIYSANLGRWSSCRSKIKSNVGTATKIQRGSPPLSRNHSPEQRAEAKSVMSRYTATATNSSSSNSSCSSSSPAVSIDSSSVHSVDTLKASNMPMAMIVANACWEDDIIEKLKD